MSSSSCASNEYSDGSCHLCSSKIAYCSACTYSKTTQFEVVCTGCQAGYSLKSVQGYNVCKPSNCTVVDPNNGYCISCSSGKPNIQTGLCESPCPSDMLDSGTQCVCNSTSYFNSLFHQCKACSSIHVNCTACSFDSTNNEGDCNTCSYGVPSTDK